MTTTQRLIIDALQRKNKPLGLAELVEAGVERSDAVLKANLDGLVAEGLVELVNSQTAVRLFFRLHPADAHLVPLVDVHRWQLTKLGKAV